MKFINNKKKSIKIIILAMTSSCFAADMSLDRNTQQLDNERKTRMAKTLEYGKQRAALLAEDSRVRAGIIDVYTKERDRLFKEFNEKNERLKKEKEENDQKAAFERRPSVSDFREFDPENELPEQPKEEGDASRILEKMARNAFALTQKICKVAKIKSKEEEVEYAKAYGDDYRNKYGEESFKIRSKFGPFTTLDWVGGELPGFRSSPGMCGTLSINGIDSFDSLMKQHVIKYPMSKFVEAFRSFNDEALFTLAERGIDFDEVYSDLMKTQNLEDSSKRTEN